MKIFILNNKIKDVSILKEIIYNNSLSSLVGDSNNMLDALEEILFVEPDLLILDFADEESLNFEIIDKIRENDIETKFIVMSSLNSEDAINSAYENGAEYYIRKPINEIEFINIVKRMKYYMELEEKVEKVKQIFNTLDPFHKKVVKKQSCEQDINTILLRLGVMGEKGSEDIIEVSKFIIENQVNIHEMTIRELCSKLTDNPKSMEQKMRRAINLAMGNIASLGIEDFMNETFTEYANTLFNFEQVKREMDYIRGKSHEKGSINMKKFLSGINVYCEGLND